MRTTVAGRGVWLGHRGVDVSKALAIQLSCVDGNSRQQIYVAWTVAGYLLQHGSGNYVVVPAGSYLF